MTRSDIDKLEAGPAADVAVARAKGAKRNPLPADGEVCISVRNGKPQKANVDGDGDLWVSPWSPSTSIADAMDLYDWLLEHCEGVSLHSGYDAFKKVRHQVRTLFDAHIGSGDTKQMAIVRAYLIAAGGGK